MLPSQMESSHTQDRQNDSERRKPSASYRTRVAIGVDLARISMSDDAKGVTLGDRATIPPLLEKHAENNSQTMPDGLYGFFGDDAELSLKKQVTYNLEEHKGEKPPIWDLTTNLEFTWRDPYDRPHAATMAWKDPADLQGAFLRIGRVSGRTNDILRFYTGDRRAIDRLTLEPWNIDEYASALKHVYGNIRAIIFDALMADGSVQAVVKIYDPSVIEASGLRPLFRFLSSHDPDQAQSFDLPDVSWSGWGVRRNLISDLDKADLTSFVAQPEDNKELQQILVNRRARELRAEGRFKPRHKEIKAVAKYRKQQAMPKSVMDAETSRSGQGLNGNLPSEVVPRYART